MSIYKMYVCVCLHMCVCTQVLMCACQYMCRRYTHIYGVHVFTLISSKYRMCVCACMCGICGDPSESEYSKLLRSLKGMLCL